MSHTKRNKRPQFNLGNLVKKQYPDGKVRDGTRTHAAKSCESHGGCPYCESNRTHSFKKRLLKAEDL